MEWTENPKVQNTDRSKRLLTVKTSYNAHLKNIKIKHEKDWIHHCQRHIHLPSLQISYTYYQYNQGPLVLTENTTRAKEQYARQLD